MIDHMAAEADFTYDPEFDEDEENDLGNVPECFGSGSYACGSEICDWCEYESECAPDNRTKQPSLWKLKKRMGKMEKKKYVIGFLFKFQDGHWWVGLIKKNRPDWQKGKLNGIGGHIEENETPDEAMRREFQEETGATCNWEFYCTMVFDEALVYCYRSKDKAEIKTTTDEKVGWYPIDFLPENIIPNLNWLIPLAQQCEKQMIQVDMIQKHDALYSDPPSPESKRDYGLCSSCQFQASAGDYGTIKDCDNTSEELPDYAVKYGDLLGEDEKHQCPIWKPIAPYYCKEHHKWTDGIWAGSCDECLKRIAEETNEQK